jgi:hypothetical protein
MARDDWVLYDFILGEETMVLLEVAATQTARFHPQQTLLRSHERHFELNVLETAICHLGHRKCFHD